MTPTLYVPPDFHAETERWEFSCGHAALAAFAQRPLAQIEPHLSAGYTTPTRMRKALESMGIRYRVLPERRVAPGIGLALVQFTGPWTEPGAPVRWAYRYTHWIATHENASLVYDVNHNEWLTRPIWEHSTLPLLTEDIARADGGYFIRSAIASVDAERPASVGV